MIHKNLSVPASVVMTGRANGWVIEARTKRYFKGRWPGLFLPPTNEGHYKQHDPADFRLRVGELVLGVDVWGPRVGSGLFKHKAPTDIHLKCKEHRGDVVWVGWVRGQRGKKTHMRPVFSPESLVNLLNKSQAHSQGRLGRLSK